MNKLILLTSVAILCFESISESRAACESGQKQCGNACISDNASCYSCGDDCHAYLTDDTAKTGGFKLNV